VPPVSLPAPPVSLPEPPLSAPASPVSLAAPPDAMLPPVAPPELAAPPEPVSPPLEFGATHWSSEQVSFPQSSPSQVSRSSLKPLQPVLTSQMEVRRDSRCFNKGLSLSSEILYREVHNRGAECQKG